MAVNKSVNTDKVKELLGAGLSVPVVSSALGVSPNYISELMSDPQFAEAVALIKISSLTEATDRDKKINKLEDEFIDKLNDVKDLMYKPQEVLRALAMINKMDRRGVPADVSLAGSKDTIIQLDIPSVLIQQHITNNIVLNTQGEVVEVAGQTMVSMPAHQLLRNLQLQDKEEGNERYKKVANLLPPALEVGSG